MPHPIRKGGQRCETGRLLDRAADDIPRRWGGGEEVVHASTLQMPAHKAENAAHASPAGNSWVKVTGPGYWVSNSGVPGCG